MVQQFFLQKLKVALLIIVAGLNVSPFEINQNFPPIDGQWEEDIDRFMKEVGQKLVSQPTTFFHITEEQLCAQFEGYYVEISLPQKIIVTSDDTIIPLDEYSTTYQNNILLLKNKRGETFNITFTDNLHIKIVQEYKNKTATFYLKKVNNPQ